MKKLVLVLTLLLVSVFCTGCINNLAIQELNNKAKDYLKAGDAESAVCRLKSSLDLDANFFETNYNLAIAYIDLKKYSEAKDAIEHAIKINPDFPDSYYTMGVIYENLADEKTLGETKTDEDETSMNESEDNIDTEKKLSEADKKEIVDLYHNSVENYEKYLQMPVSNQTKQDVQKIIVNINNEIAKYSEDGLQ